MIKKKHLKKNQSILRTIFLKREFELLLLKSLKRNFFIYWLDRLGYFKNNNDTRWFYYKSKQKLMCFYSLGLKIPDRRFNYSRFYLNRQLNTNTMGGTYK